MSRSRYETKLDRYHVFTAVKAFIAAHGFSPSYRELAGMTTVRSISTIREHLFSLQRDEHLTFNPTCRRTIRLTGSEPARPIQYNEFEDIA